MQRDRRDWGISEMRRPVKMSEKSATCVAESSQRPAGARGLASPTNAAQLALSSYEASSTAKKKKKRANWAKTDLETVLG